MYGTILHAAGPLLLSLLYSSHPPPPSVPEALEIGRLHSHLCQVQKDPSKFCEACGGSVGCEEDADCRVVHLVVVEGTMVLNLE